MSDIYIYEETARPPKPNHGNNCNGHFTKDNKEIRVGFCDNCDHPLWNDDVNVLRV